VYNDFLHDKLANPWRERAAGFGIKSAAAFPIVSHGNLNPQTKEAAWDTINAIPQFREGEESPYRTFVTLHDITALNNAEKEQEAAVDFLRLLNTCKSKAEMVRSATGFFQRRSACETVGIRLREGNDYPYFEVRGFS